MPLQKARQRARIARFRHVQRRGDRIPSADFGAELAERRGDGVGIGARCAHAERERRRFLRGRHALYIVIMEHTRAWGPVA